MPAYQISVETIIDEVAQPIHDSLTDFNTWPSWSPWLYYEPDARIDYSGDPGSVGHGFQWQGRKIGAGSMALTRIEADRIECNLTFIKPFKSRANVAFELSPAGADSTRVTWHMQGKLPFFLFFMKVTANKSAYSLLPNCPYDMFHGRSASNASSVSAAAMRPMTFCR